jgi:hypothetical protein
VTKAELSAEHVTEGKRSLKLTFNAGWGVGLHLSGLEQPQDWSQYQSLSLDVYNPQPYALEFTPRIDTAEAGSFQQRFEPSGAFYLPPQRSTHVVIRLDDLQGNDFRLLDTARITYLGFHLGDGAAGRTLFLDAVQLHPYPKDKLPEPIVPAVAPRLIADGEAAAKSLELWKSSDAKVEVVATNVTGGKYAIRVMYPKGNQWPGLKIDCKDQPMDWRPYQSLEFDAYNPQARPLNIMVRIDDINAVNIESRFTLENIGLEPRQKTEVKIDIGRMMSRCGRRMDKSKITLLSIFMNSADMESEVLFDNIRLGVAGGGLLNELTPGRIPGKTPRKLAKDMLEDPEIKPLIPIFKAMPPRRFALLSHTASIPDHFATSGGYLNIVAETIKLANPACEYKGFHQEMMAADQAAGRFLQAMIAYKPTDTFIAMFPDPVSSLRQIGDEMVKLGGRVYIMDLLPWLEYAPGTTAAIRNYARQNPDSVMFVELAPRSWGAPGSYKWRANDNAHMMTSGHIFYARELLKELAIVYGPKTAGSKPKP